MSYFVIHSHTNTLKRLLSICPNFGRGGGPSGSIAIFIVSKIPQFFHGFLRSEIYAKICQKVDFLKVLFPIFPSAKFEKEVKCIVVFCLPTCNLTPDQTSDYQPTILIFQTLFSQIVCNGQIDSLKMLSFFQYFKTFQKIIKCQSF